MLKKITLCLLLLAANLQAAEPTEFDIRWISDQHVLGINKEAGHATYMPYASQDLMTSDEYYNTPWIDPQKAMYLNLNGTWKFKWVRGTKDGPGPSEFQAANLDDSQWDEIRVPMSWEMDSRYNKPTYNNTGYPFHNNPPYAMEGYEEHGITDHNATGFYRRTFDLPADWADKRVFIHFDGVYSCCVVWVNGTFVGYSQGANNVAEFDLSKVVRPGRNQLSVRVYRWCDGSYLEGQDMWRISGIHRDVYLFATPKAFISDHYITVSQQSADATEGNLNVALSLDNRDGGKTTKTIKMELTDAAGKVIASDQKDVSIEGTSASITLSTGLLKGLTPWHAERPYLYNVTITQQAGGKEEMVFSTKYGFRNIQVVNNGDNHYYTINGKRIFFKGTNIHDTHPLYGRYVDVETMLRDITLMKQANINTVRTSHYLRQAKMNAMFDAYGLYVMDEGDLECHGNQTLTRDTAWTQAFVDRDVRMVLRDRNHPSIVFWSLGNENDDGENMLHCYDAIRRIDSRFIHCHGEDRASDMYSEMYPTVEHVKHMSHGHNGKPYFLCEYAHAMGQAVGNLVDYWKVIESSTGIVGACIWDWVDQGIYDPAKIKNSNLTDHNGFHAWTGGYDFDPWFERHANNNRSFQGNFLNNGIITPDRQWTAKLTEVKKVYQYVEFARKDGYTIAVKNKYPFSNLADLFYLEYAVQRDGQEVEQGVMDINVAAGTSSLVELPVKTAVGNDAEYALLVGLCLKEGKPWAEQGYRLADEQFLLNERKPLPNIADKGKLRVKGNQVVGKDFSVTFNDDGMLSSYIYKGKELIHAAPEYNDYRIIDNDTRPSDKVEGYNYAATGIESHQVTAPLKKLHNQASLTMQAKGSKTDYAITYTVYANGVVDMAVSFQPQQRGLRRLGMGMQFAPGFNEVEYYAKGPWSNYKDRQTGSYLGRYKSTIRGMVDENTHPQTYGDHQELRDLLLINKDTGINLRIQTQGTVAFSLSHYNELEWNHPLPFTKLHWSDLVEHPQLFAHFDYWQRGIGNASCGGDSCLPQYETPYPGHYQGASELTYTLRFTPVGR